MFRSETVSLSDLIKNVGTQFGTVCEPLGWMACKQPLI